MNNRTQAIISLLTSNLASLVAYDSELSIRLNDSLHCVTLSPNYLAIGPYLVPGLACEELELIHSRVEQHHCASYSKMI